MARVYPDVAVDPLPDRVTEQRRSNLQTTVHPPPPSQEEDQSTTQSNQSLCYHRYAEHGQIKPGLGQNRMQTEQRDSLQRPPACLGGLGCVGSWVGEGVSGWVSGLAAAQPPAPPPQRCHSAVA